ncbi:hypothetical protein TWF173_008119 [Orbilia oligospora]|nr:hypothetical protein TWF173_008119 [Orbilia oligospora]
MVGLRRGSQMTSIVTLARAPEILYEILQYVTDTEVLNVALTCRSLSVPCSCYLWRTLRIEKSVYSPSGRVVASNARTRTVISHYWAESRWLRYTRYVVIGGIRDYFAPQVDGISRLLDAERLCPNRVDLEILLSPEDIPPLMRWKCYGYLDDLKRYSRYRSSQEFSILLKSNVVHTLPKFVELAKVTKLTLAVSVEPALDDYSVANGIDDLVLVLKETVNVDYFAWDGRVKGSKKYKISTIWDSLKKLQATVTDLRHLRHLKILRYLYHPSFFLAPPKSVRILSLYCITSEAWWRSFAVCPLSGVEELSINYATGCDSSEGLKGFVEPATTKLNDIMLVDVAARGLRKFSCNRSLSSIPQNLGECILRNNRDLDLNSRKQIKRQNAVKLATECHDLYEEEHRKCLGLIVPRYTRKFAEGYKVDVEESLKFMAEWAEMLALTVEPDYLEGIDNWIAEKDRTESVGARENGVDCLGIETRDHKKWDIRENDIEKARNFVVPLVYEFSGAIRSVKFRVIDAIAERLANCENVGRETAMKMLVEDVVVRIRNVRQGIRDFN